MRFVIVYDISHDAVRLRVADLLGAWGSRVQESVFECIAEPGDLDSMTAALSRLIEPDETAHVRIYRLCADCWQEAIGIGRNVPRDTSACTIV
jgi:CRISPR-associated protein Cas2